MQSEATTKGAGARGRAVGVGEGVGGGRRGRAAVSQARLILLVMINVAQLWILAATVEAALSHHYRLLAPLTVASGLCWLVTLSLALWWRPVSRRHTSTGYLRETEADRR